MSLHEKAGILFSLITEEIMFLTAAVELICIVVVPSSLC